MLQRYCETLFDRQRRWSIRPESIVNSSRAPGFGGCWMLPASRSASTWWMVDAAGLATQRQHDIKVAFDGELRPSADLPSPTASKRSNLPGLPTRNCGRSWCCCTRRASSAGGGRGAQRGPLRCSSLGEAVAGRPDCPVPRIPGLQAEGETAVLVHWTLAADAGARTSRSYDAMLHAPSPCRWPCARHAYGGLRSACSSRCCRCSRLISWRTWSRRPAECDGVVKG